MDSERAADSAQVVRSGEGDILGEIEAVRDHFMLEGRGDISIVQHLMPGQALAGPLHIHSREDEYSFVLEGRVGALLGEDEVIAEVGDLIFKPRGQWHTFWNAGDQPARVLEIISPGGFEQAFREMHALAENLDPAAMAEIAGRYGCQVDFERTSEFLERHGLRFSR